MKKLILIFLAACSLTLSVPAVSAPKNFHPEEYGFRPVSPHTACWRGYFCQYDITDDHIDVLYKDGTIKDIAEASEILNVELLSKKICKYYLSYQRI